MQAWRRLRTQVISHHNLSHQQKMEFMIGLLAIHVTSKFRITSSCFHLQQVGQRPVHL